MKENLKMIIIVIIITIAFLGINYSLNYFVNNSLKDERPNDLYREMQEISNNKTLIGLSKKEVEKLLGKPRYKFNDETGNIYAYSAGKLDTGIFLGNTAILFDCTYDCELRISFDEDDKVKKTSIHRNP